MRQLGNLNRVLNSLVFLVIICFVTANLEQILSIPNINLLIIFLAAVAIVRNLYLFQTNKKEIIAEEIFNIRGQYDRLSKVFHVVLLLGAIFYLVCQFQQELSSSQIFMFSVLIALFSVVAFTDSAESHFRKISEHKIKMDDKNFFIESDLVSIECSKFSITKIDANGGNEVLSKVLLNKDEAQKLKTWVSRKLNNPQIKFYWKERDVVELLS